MADVVACNFQSAKGKLNVGNDGKFAWRPDAAAPAGAILPSGLVQDVGSMLSSKVVPGKPIALKVSMADGKTSFILSFDSVEARQRAKTLLETPIPAGGSATDLRSSPVTASSTSPIPANTFDGRPIPKITISSSGPVSFNVGQLATLTTEELQARAAVLKKDPELKQLHAKLVDVKLISDDDFWVGKEARVQEERLLLRQKQGLSPEALIDPVVGNGVLTGPAQEVEMTMTAEMIERVFREHPDVLRKYKENVPHKMSEKQFWTAYLHCKYVLGTKRNVDRQGENKGMIKRRNQRAEEEQRRAAEIFGDVNEYRLHYREELENEFSKRIRNIDASIDLRATMDDSLTVSPINGLTRSAIGGYGLASRSYSDMLVVKSEKELARSLRASSKPVDKETAQLITKAVKDDPVLTKINERASLALTSSDPGALAESEELRRARLEQDHKDELHLDMDLETVAGPAVVELKLAPSAQSQMLQSTSNTTTGTQKVNGGSMHRKPIAIEPVQSLPLATAFYVGDVETEAEARLAKLDPTLKGLPATIREAFLVATAALDEYCRHYWTSTSNAEMKKRCLIIQKMKDVHRQIDVDLRAAMRHAASDALPLLRLPMEQMGRCFAEHDKKCKLPH